MRTLRPLRIYKTLRKAESPHGRWQPRICHPAADPTHRRTAASAHFGLSDKNVRATQPPCRANLDRGEMARDH